jgi:hypothetical protein
MYVNAFAPLTLLRAEKLDAPAVDMDSLHNFARGLKTKATGRFRTLPQEVVFGTAKRAIELVLEHGEHIVASYLSLAERSVRAGVSIAAYADRGGINEYIDPRTVALGVKRWTIEPVNGCGERRVPKQDWFLDLRQNCGLRELVHVLYGAIGVVLGLLAARRLGELTELKAGHCLDATRSRLVFRNRKSGLKGLRDQEIRPIPPLGVRFVDLLTSVQDGLVACGAIPERTYLFAPPTAAGCTLLKENRRSYFLNLDIFCDWAETPLDSEGRRYYLRQHQLRRFFAMLFFWGEGFGGMDTLRWFMGHTDTKQLWHYITESTPGATIRSVAAEWAVYQLQHETPQANLLAEELHSQYGISDFTVIEADALASHIEDLLEEGSVSIEPQFLDNGALYRIAIIVRSRMAS